MPFDKIVVPAEGQKITLAGGKLHVPDNPILCFIEGDGTGVDIWAASQPVLDAAVEQAYGGRRKIAWMEVYAGEKANAVYGETIWLPQETLDAIDEYIVAIKGPLTTPVGGGIRSINVALRQRLDLYACVRPVQYFSGVPSPVKHPELVNMVIFRENSEDIYAGIEFEQGTDDCERFLAMFREAFPSRFQKIRFPVTYELASPDDVRFTPLGMETAMTLSEILMVHPKGLEYGSILAGQSRLPLLRDADHRPLSFPPIINSREIGEVLVGDDELFVEVTGTDAAMVVLTLNIFAVNLADRGATIQPIAVRDVLHYLIGAATLPADVNRTFDIGGPDVLRYGQMMNGYALELTGNGHELIYTFDAQAEHSGIAALLKRLDEQGIAFKDLNTEQSSLEEIFVNLVRQAR